LANGFLDYYDPFLAADTFPSQFIASMDTLILSGCFSVEEINACPVLIKSTYDTACECDTEITPFFAISPAFVAEIPTTNTLCLGEEIGVEFCGDYEFTFDDTEGYMSHLFK